MMDLTIAKLIDVDSIRSLSDTQLQWKAQDIRFDLINEFEVPKINLLLAHLVLLQGEQLARLAVEVEGLK